MSMKAIQFVHKGNFNHLEHYVAKVTKSKRILMSILNRYGQKGVDALREATPKDTGKTSESWSYKIVEDNGNYRITWSNSNTVGDKYKVNVAILLQYGHATRDGGYVQGIDYINPAIQKIFKSMADEAWKEVFQIGRGN